MIDSNGDEFRLGLSSEDELDGGAVQMWRVNTGQPSVIYLKNPGVMRIALIPDEAYTMYVGAWVMPSRDSYEAPAFIYDKYLETIACGAKARIMNMKGRSRYNPTAAAGEMAEYEAKRSSAAIDSTKSHTRVSKSSVLLPES